MAYEFDYDFIGFTYGGKHSIKDFGVYRTSDGDRYNENLIPTLADITADVPNGNGQYFFGTNYKVKIFTLQLAFDNLSDELYKDMRKWLDGSTIQDLIFDEAPYKVYSAKVTGMPMLKTICFENEGKRVYKGEGSVDFTCYYPFAHTPIKAKNGFDGRSAQNYVPNQFPTKEQWLPTSKLPDKHRDGNNFGDLPAPFELNTKYNFPIKKNDILRVGDMIITILEDAVNVSWNSKTGLVTGEVDGVVRPIKVKGEGYGTIPVSGIDTAKKPTLLSLSTIEEGKEVIYCSNQYKYVDGILESNFQTPPFTIEYSYWYF